MQRSQVWRAGAAALVLVTAATWVWAAGAAGFDQVSKRNLSYTSSTAFPADSPQLTVDRAQNRITLSSAGPADLTFLAGPQAKMMSFQVGTLTNPEIRVPKGATLTLTVINVDDDMVHDLYLIGQAPPYARSVSASSVGSAVLKPYKGQSYSVTQLVVKASQPGTSYYVCTIPGHAKAGMYGKIVVE